MCKDTTELFNKTVAALEEQVELLAKSGNAVEAQVRQSNVLALCEVVRTLREG